MKIFLVSLLAAAGEAPPNAEDSFNHALWQFPVACLVIGVVVLFLRYLKKEREAQQKFLSETNALDREAREKAQERYTETLVAVQDRSDNERRVMVDTFTKTQTEATKNQTALTSRAIDTIDRNTEAFGEVKALLRETHSQLRAVRKKDDDE